MQSITFISKAAAMGLAYESSHDLSLAFASYAIAVFTAYTTLRISKFIGEFTEKSVHFSLLAVGSVTIGVGIWTIHLIATMAYSLPVAISYEPTAMLGSILPAIFSAAVMLYLLTKSKPNIFQLLAGGIIIGSGIGSMHYMKMSAISNTVAISYEPFLFFISLIVGIALAIIALFLNLQLITAEVRRTAPVQWLGPLTMGLAFVAMHYVAMSATYFIAIDTASLSYQIDPGLPLARLAVVCSILLSMLFVASRANRLDQEKNRLAAEISDYKKLEVSLMQEKESLKLISDEHAVLAQSNEARLESIFNSMADGLIVISKEGVIEDFNPSALRLFGYTHEELAGMNVSALIPKSRGFEHDGFTESYLKMGRIEIVGTGREALCHHKNGSTFHAHLSVAEFTAGENKLFTGIIHDISDRVAAEEELRTAIKEADRASIAKSEFLANMSHEIRTPLNGVMGMLELLQSTSLDVRQGNYVKTAYSSANSLLSVISSILDFSQMESGSVNSKSELFDIRKVLESSIGLAAADSAKKGLEFNCLVTEDVPGTLSGDAEHLQKIIHNLASNAVKFTQSGEINIRVALTTIEDLKAQIFIEVQDTGIGIAEDKLEHLFQAFTQQDNSASRKYGGSGLGLAVTKRLIDLMDGEIKVISKEGRGTTFGFSLWFEIPDIEEETTITAFANEPRVLVVGDNITRNKSELANKNVLIVDDMPTNLRVGKEMMRKLGVEPDLATNGSEAIEALAAKQYDLVLMDCQMPVMDGYMATREIRALEKASGQKQRLPIVAVTAHALEGDREASLEAGMDDHLTKPFAISELESLIDRWLL